MMSEYDVKTKSYKTGVAHDLTSVHRCYSDQKVLFNRFSHFAMCCGFLKVGLGLGKGIKGI